MENIYKEVLKLEKLKKDMCSVIYSDHPYILELSEIITNLKNNVFDTVKSVKRSVGSLSKKEYNEKCFNSVLNILCDYYGFQPEYIKRVMLNKERHEHYMVLFHMLRFILRTEFSITTTMVGELTNCDHSTVTHSYKTIHKLRESRAKGNINKKKEKLINDLDNVLAIIDETGIRLHAILSIVDSQKQ